MNSGKGSTILLTMISVATLLVAVVGATFAYFSATIDGSESQTTIEVTSGTLSTEYNDNRFISKSNLNPGDVLTNKEFTITGVVTGSTNLNYEATLVVKNNTYSTGALVYTLTSVNTSNNGRTIASTSEEVAIPTGASTISLGNGVFAGPTSTGSVHKYILNIKFKNTGADQTADLGKAFDAQVSITQSKK